MDPASSIVEKVVETKNGTQEVDAGVIEMATKNIDNSVESPLESNIGSNVGQSITSTDDNDDADLVIEESESDEHSSDGERTSDVAETEDLIKVAEIDKPSLSSDANSTAEINGSAEIESEDPTVEDSSIKSDPETSVLDSTKADKRSTVSEENPNVEVIDENIVIVSTSDARMANVPQETSKIIIEGDEVKRTEEVALKDCTESLTEKGAKEPTTCELTAENTKNEVFSPIENVNELKELGKNAVENKDVKLFQETQQGREANEITDQSELLNDNIRDREHLRLSNQTDFNNQILDIISDIDINIKAQEKITQLKEQELKLIQKQNELANQIHQQQILAQQLNAKNTIKQSQFQSDKFDSKCQQQNDRDVSTLTLNQNNVISKEHTDIPKTIDLRKIFTPATDATEILPKNRKLYASSAFYSPTLHPTVEDQVELARRISHSLSDISNQTSKGQSMYVNRKKRSDKWVHEDYQQYQQKPAISPNILPAYSDAGKHRVQWFSLLGMQLYKLVQPVQRFWKIRIPKVNVSHLLPYHPLRTSKVVEGILRMLWNLRTIVLRRIIIMPLLLHRNQPMYPRTPKGSLHTHHPLLRAGEVAMWNYQKAYMYRKRYLFQATQHLHSSTPGTMNILNHQTMALFRVLYQGLTSLLFKVRLETMALASFHYQSHCHLGLALYRQSSSFTRRLAIKESQLDPKTSRLRLALTLRL
ncbi:putative leucine-rich repeat-containing protein DDB_G0290503 isoform X25 [Drosophila suzukii]|uniref:Leucine-rich repeat-containing protein DDB_G0290503 isoform X25 n=1 Tax=Drosophila suzukii TaxID=28584 RepID=A0AB40DGR5_DROSZ